VWTREDVITGVFDNALTAAEEYLGELLPDMTNAEIAERFAQFIQTHLSTELENIRAHGHRNDDPEDVPGKDDVPEYAPEIIGRGENGSLWIRGSDGIDREVK
jgi:hypothetical protein